MHKKEMKQKGGGNKVNSEWNAFRKRVWEGKKKSNSPLHVSPFIFIPLVDVQFRYCRPISIANYL